MSYHCRKATFTEEDFDASKERFWAMPSKWGDPEDSVLAQMWTKGRSGLISMVPILGQFAAMQAADRVYLSVEEIARLGGIDPSTVTAAKGALADGWAQSEVRCWGPGKITKWDISKQFLAERRDGRYTQDHFRFGCHLIYGGNWARLTKTQKLVYLAIASRTATYNNEDDFNWVRRHLLPDTMTDINRCWDEEGRVRMASFVSYCELARITGLARSSVVKAVKGFKHPDVWPDVMNDPDQLRFSPIAVYPAVSGGCIYHMRDHVPHWPWDELNRHTTPPGNDEEGGDHVEFV